MSRSNEESPYRDEPAPYVPAATRRGSSNRKPAAAKPPASERRNRRPAVETKSPAASPAARPAAARKTRSRKRGRAAYARQPELTSLPTSRLAYAETRAWLLEQHGPVCAYCGAKVTARAISLDHVAPRRGLTAYDRRDNLVLACVPCNAAKRDLPPLAFLLASRKRAENLLRYGQHLSPMLVDLARSLVPEDFAFDERAIATGEDIDRWAAFGGDDDDGDSPYRD